MCFCSNIVPFLANRRDHVMFFNRASPVKSQPTNQSALSLRLSQLPGSFVCSLQPRGPHETLRRSSLHLLISVLLPELRVAVY